MEILFRTKEESNASRRAAFLSLTPEQRVRSFIRHVYFFNTAKIGTSKYKKNKNSDNFIIQL